MEVVAPGPIQAKSFDAEVVANFSFILLGNMNFFPDFLIAVCKGALDSPEGTFYRKGQYPFSTRYLHFYIQKKATSVLYLTLKSLVLVMLVFLV